MNSIVRTSSRAAQRRRVIVGIGNWMFPRSRYSVGLYLVDKFAEKLKLRWSDDENTISFIAESPDLILVKPKTYLIDENVRSIDAVLKTFRTDPRLFVVLHFDANLEFGQYKITNRWLSLQNPILTAISKVLDTEYFIRFGIGVMHPSWRRYNWECLFGYDFDDTDLLQFHLTNKWPPEERKAIDTVITGDVCFALDKLVTLSRDEITNSQIFDNLTSSLPPRNYYSLVWKNKKIEEKTNTANNSNNSKQSHPMLQPTQEQLNSQHNL
jgi:peptidyl-tRNA hydrolase